MIKPTRYIKFIGKKCVMKPFENESGKIETWEVSESIGTSKEFFKYKGQNYILTSSTEKIK